MLRRLGRRRGRQAAERLHPKAQGREGRGEGRKFRCAQAPGQDGHNDPRFLQSLGPAIPGFGGERRGADDGAQGLERHFKGPLHRRESLCRGLVHQRQQHLALKHALGDVIEGHPLLCQNRANGGQQGRMLRAPNGQHSTGCIHEHSSPCFPKKRAAAPGRTHYTLLRASRLNLAKPRMP